MAFPIGEKLVVAVSSNALFALEDADRVYREQGVEAYRAYQLEHKREPLAPGRAFPFIRRLLRFNEVYPEESPIDVVLLSRNSPETGLRAFESIRHHSLSISRAAFTNGRAPFKYIPAFNVSLFLSTNAEDVRNAIEAGFPAGTILPSDVADDSADTELRVAFDFDGVVASDEAERVYQGSGRDLQVFQQHEVAHADQPLAPGLLADFLRKLSALQKLEAARGTEHVRMLRTAIITARGAPSHERAITTLRSWNVEVDEMVLMGGVEKRRVLEVLRPHLFVDDQLVHLDQRLRDVALVHLPFGITNSH